MRQVSNEDPGGAWIEGKDRRLEVLSPAPLVLSTPISLLAGHRITDKHSLFVRNIQDLAAGHTVEPRPIEGWEIELVGLITPSRLVIHAEELIEMDDAQVKYVTAEGEDGPMGRELPDMEHSLPVADVVDRSILALKLNGEPLPGIHGGPVRLVTPGFFGPRGRSAS